MGVIHCWGSYLRGEEDEHDGDEMSQDLDSIVFFVLEDVVVLNVEFTT